MTPTVWPSRRAGHAVKGGDRRHGAMVPRRAAFGWEYSLNRLVGEHSRKPAACRLSPTSP